MRPESHIRRKIISPRRRQASTREEVGGIARHWSSTRNLNNPSDANNLSPVEIHTFEAIPIRCTSCELFLDFIGVSHQLDSFVGVEISPPGGEAG